MKAETVRIPKAPPLATALQDAAATLRDFKLHFYQLLLFQNPPLTGCNSERPFRVSHYDENIVGPGHHIRITHYDRPEYAFTVSARELIDDIAITRTDEKVLNNCRLILDAISENKQKVRPAACCPLAVQAHCVCTFKSDCVIHGQRCNGSHD